MCLDIPKFVPRIKWYSRHFLPTVRSLAPGGPKGSRRQTIWICLHLIPPDSLMYSSTTSGVRSPAPQAGGAGQLEEQEIATRLEADNDTRGFPLTREGNHLHDLG